MSEFAERMVQKMLPELNKMRDLKLFTTVEVSKILKKRRAHEYKTKRKIKQLKDHLQYIDYEIMVMELIKKRRKMTNCHTNKRDIEVSIIKRIHRLFQTASIKFSGCVEVFLKHIEFCIKMKEKITVSVLFTQALKLHTHNENLWIMAAKHEMERNNSMSGARNLFHRSLRFNPHSKKLYLEYFKMELLNAEKLRKRKELLLGGGADNNAAATTTAAAAANDDDDEATATAAADDHDDKDAGDEKDEEERNNIMNGSVAFVVFQEAVKEFPGDVSFCMQFIDICHLFDFARWIEDAIYKHLSADTDLSTNAAAQVVVVCQKLTEVAHKLDGSGGVILSRESKAAAVESAIEQSWNSFNDSLKELNTESKWEIYYDKLLSTSKMTSMSDDSLNQLTKHMLVICLECADRNMMSESLAIKWIELLTELNENEFACQIVPLLASKFPCNATIWLLLFSLITSTQGSDVQTVLDLLLESMRYIVNKPETIQIWKMVTSWMVMPPEKMEQMFEISIGTNNRNLTTTMKEEYLNWAIQSKPVKYFRKLFNKLSMSRPLSVKLFNLYIEAELSQPNVKSVKVREAYEVGVSEFGQENVDLWMDYVKFEISHGNPENVGQIYFRAVKKLNPGLESNFIEQYSLFKCENSII